MLRCQTFIKFVYISNFAIWKNTLKWLLRSFCDNVRNFDIFPNFSYSILNHSAKTQGEIKKENKIFKLYHNRLDSSFNWKMSSICIKYVPIVRSSSSNPKQNHMVAFLCCIVLSNAKSIIIKPSFIWVIKLCQFYNFLTSTQTSSCCFLSLHPRPHSLHVPEFA